MQRSGKNSCLLNIIKYFFLKGGNMDLIKYAIEMEEESKKYYLELAEKCANNEGVKNILKMLAFEHEKHSEAFQFINEDQYQKLENSVSFREVDKLFKKMKADKQTFSCDIDQVDLYKKALDLVRKKYDFYKEALSTVESLDSKKLLKKIVEEEHHQKYVLENLVEMVTRPDKWLENAEFYHFDEY
jgi:rubrerythrin